MSSSSPGSVHDLLTTRATIMKAAPDQASAVVGYLNAMLLGPNRRKRGMMATLTRRRLLLSPTLARFAGIEKQPAASVLLEEVKRASHGPRACARSGTK